MPHGWEVLVQGLDRCHLLAPPVHCLYGPEMPETPPRLEPHADGRRRAQPRSLTVAGALELEIFQRGMATVVAGAGHLDRVVRWVHSAEISDIATFLTGGEMLLTAGTGIGSDEAGQRAYVRSISAAGVAVLALELSGRAFAVMPSVIIEEAERAALPVVALAREIPFVEAAAQVHSRIVDLRVQALLDEEAASRAFTELLLSGRDYLAMVQELSARAGHPCVLEDRAHQLRAYCGGISATDDLMSTWQEHSRHQHQPDGDGGCTREPIALKGEVWGWLHVLHRDRLLSGPDLYAINRAAAAIAITLLTEQVRGARRSQRDGALISRLMLGDISGHGFVERALRLGRDVRGRSLLVVVTSAPHEGQPFGQPELTECLAVAGAVAIVADTCDSALAVVALPADKGEAAVMAALSCAAARVGVSRVVKPDDLLLAVQQANSAHAATAFAGTDRCLIRFDELGVLRLLVPLADGPELAAYVEDELGALLQHDVDSPNKLLPTLIEFLECDGRKSDAAQRLFVQRRTLYYRLDRLESLLGLSLDDVETRHRLHLAVRGLQLLTHRGQQHASRVH